MASHHTHDQNIRHTQSFAVAGEKSQMWFGCSCLCSRQRPLVWFSTWWGERWEERIRPDSILAWFTKSKTCVLCNCLSLFAIGARKEGLCSPPTPEWAVLRMWSFWSFAEEQQSRGRRAQANPQPGGQVWPAQAQRAQPGPGPAARAAAAQIYLGPDVFYSQNLVTTITFKWLLNGYCIISKQHWNEILIWKLWILGPSTWKGWCRRPTDRISIP